MLKRILSFLLAFQFGFIFLYFSHYNQRTSLYAQTIPTVTPTGSAATATSLPEPTATEDDGNTNPLPTTTNTPNPGATVASSPTTVLAATPEDGFFPTAEPCADPPTVQAFNTLNVREGPGTNYQIIDQLAFLEVRPIIGRSQYGQWWLIELANGDSGWVTNATGLSQGYIGNVPVVPAPPINGQTPTPGAPWQHTQNPLCTVTPTHTPSATPSATSTATPTATPTAVSPTSTPTGTITSTNNNEADAATRIAQSAATGEPTTDLATAYPPRPTATPLDIVTPASTPNFLPILGLILIVGGIFIAIVRRRLSNR
jgi:hypothetical protein